MTTCNEGSTRQAFMASGSPLALRLIDGAPCPASPLTRRNSKEVVSRRIDLMSKWFYLLGATLLGALKRRHDIRNEGRIRLGDLMKFALRTRRGTQAAKKYEIGRRPAMVVEPDFEISRVVWVTSKCTRQAFFSTIDARCQTWTLTATSLILRTMTYPLFTKKIDADFPEHAFLEVRAWFRRDDRHFMGLRREAWVRETKNLSMTEFKSPGSGQQEHTGLITGPRPLQRTKGRDNYVRKEGD